MKFFAVLATILAVGSAFPSSWTLQELSEALLNPHTDPALLPILEEALNNLYAAIHAGQEIESILVPIPAIVPNDPDVYEMHPEPAAPAPAPAPAAASPLVQVIVNVNKQTQQITEVPVPEVPAIIPTPVDVVEVSPVDVTPVEVVPSPAEVDTGFNPIDIIAINPEPIGVLEPSPAGAIGPIV